MLRLSIIIPTYNSAMTVKLSLESVRQQTFGDWECIIVDGLSNDNTLDIVKGYCDIDRRFRYVSEEDTGIYNAFNKGWRFAKGEWIYFLGSDDRLVKDGFENLFSKDIDAELVGGGVYLVRDGEKDKLQYTNGIGGCHQGFIMKKEAIEKLGGFDERYRIFADKDLLIRSKKAGMIVRNYKIPIAFFYVGGISQSLKSLKTITLERYQSYKSTQYTKWPLGTCVLIYIKYLLIHLKHFVIHSKN